MKHLRLAALFLATFFAASFSQHALAYDGHHNIIAAGYVLDAYNQDLVEVKVTADITSLPANTEQERPMSLLPNRPVQISTEKTGYFLTDKMHTISFKTVFKDRPA